MQLFQLEYALKVAEMHSISLAAKELYITQPSLSQQILRLENELGVALFLRSTRGLELTEAGKDFLLYARRILAEVGEMNNSMYAYSTMTRGSIKVGMFYTSGYLSLYDDIVAFRDLHPEIDFHIQVESSSTLHHMLTARELDAAVLIAQDDILNSVDIRFDLIAENQFAAIIPLDNPLSIKTTIRLDELCDQHLILPPQGSFVRRILFDSNFDKGFQWKICAESSPTEACLQMVNSGVGVAITSINTAEIFNTGKYSVVPIVPAIRQPIYLATQKHALVVPLIQSLHQFILDRHIDFITKNSSENL